MGFTLTQGLLSALALREFALKSAKGLAQLLRYAVEGKPQIIRRQSQQRVDDIEPHPGMDKQPAGNDDVQH